MSLSEENRKDIVSYRIERANIACLIGRTGSTMINKGITNHLGRGADRNVSPLLWMRGVERS